MKRNPALSKDEVDFMIRYTPDTKTPEEICQLIAENSEIFKRLHSKGILPHRKANVDFVQKLCSFLMKNNIVPIVCMVSPFAEQRRNFIQENQR